MVEAADIWAQNGSCRTGDDFRKYYVIVNFQMQQAQLATLNKANR